MLFFSLILHFSSIKNLTLKMLPNWQKSWLLQSLLELKSKLVQTPDSILDSFPVWVHTYKYVYVCIHSTRGYQLERNITRTRLSVVLRFVQKQCVITGKVTAVSVWVPACWEPCPAWLAVGTRTRSSRTPAGLAREEFPWILKPSSSSCL